MRRVLPSAAWPVTFREVPTRWGPAPDDLCPCGSERRVRSCHGSRTGEWHVPPPLPLLSDPPTLYSNDRCYARETLDCSMKLSSAHWLSHDIVRSYSVDGRLLISGVPWLHGKEMRLPTKVLAANILCPRYPRAPQHSRRTRLACGCRGMANRMQTRSRLTPRCGTPKPPDR